MRDRPTCYRTKKRLVLINDNFVAEAFGNGTKQESSHSDVRKTVTAEILEGNGEDRDIMNRSKVYNSMESFHVAREWVENYYKEPQQREETIRVWI